jgi:hypothetical protein
LTLKKESKLGAENKWVVRTKEKALARLQKMGIPASTVQEILERRGHKDLSSKAVY